MGKVTRYIVTSINNFDKKPKKPIFVKAFASENKAKAFCKMFNANQNICFYDWHREEVEV